MMAGMTFHVDEYKAAAGRYRAGMPYRRVGRSGLDLPAISLGLWHNFGDDVPLERQQAILRRAFDKGVTHFDLANNYGPPYGTRRAQLRHALRPRLPALPRRARHQLQGRLRHVARPLRPGRWRPQVRPRQRRPVAEAHGPRLRRHLLQPPLRRDDAARGDDGRAGLPRATGQGALRRHLVLLRPAHPRGRRDPPRARHSPAHPPAVVLDAQPLGRGGPARRPRRDRRRLHRVLPVGPGDAHEQVPQGHPRGLTRLAGQEPVARPAHRGVAQARPRAQRDGEEARPDASRRWRWPGRCATTGSRRCSSAPRASSSSTTTCSPSRTSTFSDAELKAIDKHAVEAGINLWATSSTG